MEDCVVSGRFGAPTRIVSLDVGTYRGGAHLPLKGVVLLNVVINTFVTFNNTADDATTRTMRGINMTETLTKYVFPIKLVLVMFLNNRLFAKGYLVVVSMFSGHIA